MKKYTNKILVIGLLADILFSVTVIYFTFKDLEKNGKLPTTEDMITIMKKKQSTHITVTYDEKSNTEVVEEEIEVEE